MGAVDLVIQVESPKSVTAGLQRIGRAGPRRGRGLARAASSPSSAPTCSSAPWSPSACATARSSRPWCRATRSTCSPSRSWRWSPPATSWSVPRAARPGQARLPVRRAVARAARQRARHARRPLPVRGVRRAAAADRLGPRARTRSARARARCQLAVTNAGTIPDRGLYGVHLPDGRRVGELDEEMVYEARPGQTFLLGASTWRIEEITRDRVIVTPAPGAPGRGAVLEGRRRRAGPKELGARDRRVLARGGGPRARGAGRRSTTSTSARPRNLVCLPARAARGHARRAERPHDRGRALPRRDRRLAPVRAVAVRRPRARRLGAGAVGAHPRRVRPRVRRDLVGRRDHRPPARRRRAARAPSCVLVEPDELEDLVVRELSGSALFGARFRENAARALLLPRAYPGKRTPLWQQRLKAQSLLEVAKRYGQFPIVLETYRECLRDVLDLPGLEELLRGLHTRELSLVEVETQRASPFASSLLFDYVATYMYEGDTPNAERRAAALSLDRDLLRELLGQEELRELIDPGALDEVEADLQRLSERTRAANADGLHDVLRALGDLTADEAQARCLDGGVGRAHARASSRSERRAVRMRIGGEERWIAAEDAGPLPRRARRRAARRPAGGRSSSTVEEPLARLARRYARTHGPFTTARAVAAATASTSAPVLRELERAGDLVRGELRPGGTEREWCDPEVLRRLRRASLAALRKEVEPAEQRALARFLPAWQGVDAAPPGGAGVDRLREMLVPLQGLALAPGGVGARRAAAPRGRLLAGLAGPALRERRARVGRRGRARPQLAAGWRSTSARTRAGSARRRSRASRPPSRLHDAIRERLARRRRVLDRPAGRPRRGRAGRAAGGALGPRLGGRGDQRRVRAAARAAAVAGAAPSAQRRPRASPRRRRPGAPQVQGRWSLTGAAVRRRARARPAHARARRAAARALRHRHARDGAGRGHPRRLRRRSTPSWSNLETLGTARRGYFVEGLGGAQFALAGGGRAAARAALRRAGRRRWCSPPPTRPTRTARRCPGRSATTTTRTAARRACRAPTW